MISIAMKELLGHFIRWLCRSVLGHLSVTEWGGLVQLAWTVAAVSKVAEAQGQPTRFSRAKKSNLRHAQQMTARDTILSTTKVAQPLAMGDEVYPVISNVAT